MHFVVGLSTPGFPAHCGGSVVSGVQWCWLCLCRVCLHSLSSLGHGAMVPANVPGLSMQGYVVMLAGCGVSLLGLGYLLLLILIFMYPPRRGWYRNREAAATDTPLTGSDTFAMTILRCQPQALGACLGVDSRDVWWSDREDHRAFLVATFLWLPIVAFKGRRRRAAESMANSWQIHGKTNVSHRSWNPRQI
jgi:hypothetical protein